MNKQILINYEEYLKLVDDSNYNNERYDKLFHDYVKNINELQQRIDKAIEYIEQEDWNTEYDKKLLDILRGEIDESN